MRLYPVYLRVKNLHTTGSTGSQDDSLGSQDDSLQATNPAQNSPITQRRTGADLLLLRWDKKSAKAGLLIVSLYLVGFHFNEAIAQSEPSYLETLQDEASGLQLDTSTETGTATATEKSNQPLSGNRSITGSRQQTPSGFEAFSTGLTRLEFEDLLKNNYMGSYLFFKRLTEPQQGEVYDYYLENPSAAQVREKILQIKKSQ